MSNPFKGSLSRGGGVTELVDEGQHLAVIVALIDLGTHVEPGYQGAPDREVRKCFIGFELVNEVKEDGSRFVVGQEYSTSLNQKSKLVQHLQKIRGKEYTDGEAIDVTSAVGKPCQVLIQHKTSGMGRRTYARIADVTAAPKGTKVGKPENETVIFFIDADEDDLQLPEQEWLPYTIGEKLSDKIARSPEWRSVMGETNAAAQKRPVSVAVATNGHGNGNGNGNGRKVQVEEEIPF
jgi:hypothetical protein